MEVKFRPHHFLCALSFEGKGYSLKFIKNFSRIVEQLNSKYGDNILITVVDSLDDICQACPHNNDTANSCTEYAKIDELDKAHLKILHLKIGDKITWGEAKQRLKKYMTITKHHQACAECEWLKYGMCEKKLSNLHNIN